VSPFRVNGHKDNEREMTMRFVSVSAGALVSFAFCSSAAAQLPAVEATPAPVPVAPASTSPTTAPSPAASVTSAISAGAPSTPPAAIAVPVLQPVEVGKPKVEVASAVSTPAEAGKAPAEKAWYDAASLEAFVDSYASFNSNLPKPDAQSSTLGGGNQLRAYDPHSGFAMHWAGLNVSYPAEPAGGTVSLRLGPGANLHNAPDAGGGLVNVKQAFASMKPHDDITILVGKFDQPFGSEVADSQLNVNYTRSLLYWYAQPLYFTGVQADWAMSSKVDLKLIAANGWNNSIDTNRGKSFGGQLALTPDSHVSVYLGYMGGPEQADVGAVHCEAGSVFDATKVGCVPLPGAQAATNLVSIDGANSRFRHLVDVVVDWKPTSALRLLANGDYGTEKLSTGSVAWYGGNLAVQWKPRDGWQSAVRSEYFVDADGYMTGLGKRTAVTSGTVSLGYAPTKHLLIKVDQRLDVANDAVFRRGLDDTSTTQMTTTLGLVATTASVY